MISPPPMRELVSPNHGPRPPGTAIDTLVLHYTGMATAVEALARLCDPQSAVSAHYVIDEDGAITRLVPEERRAWHAGVSSWRGDSDINDRSIGIELVNPGHEFGYRPFPEAQMAALVALARDILARQPIPPARVLGHSDVAPGRKQDPGELFDWARLAREGIGLWPDVPAPSGGIPAAAEIQSWLAAIGYAVPRSGVMDGETQAAVAAFQRHFRPARVDGVVDGETAARMRALASPPGA
jgi:N-acetylmuramoyl-L-alanine amidase